MIPRLRRSLAGRRILLVPAVVIALLAGATATYAYFRSAGSETGSGAAGSLQPVTVTAFAGGDAPGSLLLPGGSTADVILRVNNPNAFTVRLVSVSQNRTITGSGGTGSCSTTGVPFTAPSTPNFGVRPSGTTFIDLSGAASMSTGSDAGCQGASFQIPVSITVHKP